ncbi:MAG: class I SAM-dependent methyltransferase, partial [Chloroflexi bacterium]|nr:class I SAM-dependent methyltransferase [Chloroflexota bacterium]
LAEAGINVVGVDPSSEMLDVARRKVQSLHESSGSVTLVQAALNDFAHDVGQRFKLILIPYSGFMSLLTVEDQERTLRSIFRSLEPGGRVAFDVAVPELDTLAQDGDVAYHLRDATDLYTGTNYVIWRQGSYDEFDQVEKVRTIVEELDGEGAVHRRILNDSQIRYAFRWELQHLLILSGFQVLDLFGDFDRSPYDRDCSDMIWIAGARS